MPTIKLGDRVRDRITTLEGIATSRTEYLDGRVLFGVTPERLEAGKAIDGEWVSPAYLDVVQVDAVELVADAALRAAEPTA